MPEPNSLFDEVLEPLTQALVSVNRVAAQRLIENCLIQSSPAAIADGVIAPVLDGIGTAWETGQASLSQLYMAGLLAEELVTLLFPPGSELRVQPAVAIAVMDDCHVLGKNIVRSVLQASGWAVADYGSLNAEQLVAKVEQDGIQILLLSALMLRSALLVETVRDLLAQRGLSTRIIVGGAPFRFNSRLWQRVGAHAMGGNASSALAILDRWSQEIEP